MVTFLAHVQVVFGKEHETVGMGVVLRQLSISQQRFVSLTISAFAPQHDIGYIAAWKRALNFGLPCVR